MEKDLNNETQKMISSTTMDQKDDATMNEGGTGSDSSTTDQKEASGGDHAAMNPGGAKMEEDHQKESGDDAALNEGAGGTNNHTKFALQLASSLKKKKEGPQTETTSAGTSSKKRRGRPGSETTTPGSGEGIFTLNTTTLNAGQDVVDAIYNHSKAIPRHYVMIHSATGYVSEIGLLDPNGPPNTRQGIFHMLNLVVNCLVDDNGRHCRAKANCRVTLNDDQGNTFGFTDVNSLIAFGPVVIVWSSFEKDVADESTARIPAAAARNSNSDPEAPIMLEGQSSCLSPTTGLFPPTPPNEDGNKNPTTTTTTSTANDQDMKSPSVEGT